MSLKIAQAKTARELGFDGSKEIFLKGEQTVIMMHEISPEHSVLYIFELNALKAEFFDCESFIMTIDDLIVSLLEGLNYDRAVAEAEQNNSDRAMD